MRNEMERAQFKKTRMMFLWTGIGFSAFSFLLLPITSSVFKLRIEFVPIMFLLSIVSIVSTSILAERLWREWKAFIWPAVLPGVGHIALAIAGAPKPRISLEGKTMKLTTGPSSDHLFSSSTQVFSLDDLQMVAIRWPGGSQWNPLAYYSHKSQSEIDFPDLMDGERFSGLIHRMQLYFDGIRQRTEKKRGAALKELRPLRFLDIYLTDYKGQSATVTLWDFFLAPVNLLDVFSECHVERRQRLDQWLARGPEVVLEKLGKKNRAFWDKEGIHSCDEVMSWDRVGQVSVVEESYGHVVKIAPMDYQANGLSKLLGAGIIKIDSTAKKVWLTVALVRFGQILMRSRDSRKTLAPQ
jgi:hypothetical protein